MDSAICSNGEAPYCDLTSGGWVPACQTCPIVVDAFDEGFHLTSLTEGVRFRVLPNDETARMSWTDSRWRNGWLALDRNGNDKIDDFTELFGDVTSQPHNGEPNGYSALAMFDDPMNGGNGNGTIDPEDSVYDHLVLWIDANHNGVSDVAELHSLREVGIFKIDLKYHLSKYIDENGNQFRFRSRVWDASDKHHDVCYDVILSVEARTGAEAP